MAKNSHQGYRVSIEPAAGHLQVMVGAETIAESHDALVMNETRQLPVVYFPRKTCGWAGSPRTVKPHIVLSKVMPATSI